MPVTMALRFPWGRYHANPWGRNVNEGVVEWPPSPWRLLRAVYCTWRARAPELPTAVMHSVLEKLACSPTYTVPPFSVGHTRHYLPDMTHMRGMSKSGATTANSDDARDKALDTFVLVAPQDALLITWPVELGGPERDALATLAALIPYLGRAESLCEGSLPADPPGVQGARLCAPIVAAGAGDEATGAPLRLLSPRQPLDLSALTVTTAALHAVRRRYPLATEHVEYTAVQPVAHLPAPRPLRPRQRVDAVRWSIDSPAPPSRHAALAMTDVLRMAVIRAARRLVSGHSEILCGKTSDGRPLTDHRHAHFLALSSRGLHDKLLDTLIAWAPAGFDDAELEALTSIARLGSRDYLSDYRPCNLGLEGFGPICSIAPELGRPSRHWRSFTPFVPARHAHRHDSWESHVVGELSRELGYRFLPALASARLLRGDALDYRTHRAKERLAAARRGTAVELELEAPIGGPLALGALSHFGMGLFMPVDTEP